MSVMTTLQPQLSVLIAHPDVLTGQRICNELLSNSIAAHLVTGGVECIRKLREQPPDVLILHSQLPWGGAEGVLAMLRDQDVIRVPVVALRAAGDVPRHSQLNAYPVLRSLAGNCAVSELLGAVRYAASFNLGRLLHMLDLEPSLMAATL